MVEVLLVAMEWYGAPRDLAVHQAECLRLERQKTFVLDGPSRLLVHLHEDSLLHGGLHSMCVSDSPRPGSVQEKLEQGMHELLCE